MQRNNHSCPNLELDKCIFKNKTLLRWLALPDSLHAKFFYILRKKITSAYLSKVFSFKTLPQQASKTLAWHFMLKAFVNLSFYTSPAIMKVYSYFFMYRQKKSKSELRHKNGL